MEEDVKCFDVEVVYPLRPATITLKISTAEVELALASDGANFRRRLMAAIYAAMAVEHGGRQIRGIVT